MPRSGGLQFPDMMYLTGISWTSPQPTFPRHLCLWTNAARCHVTKQGKTAMFACGRSGANVKKLLAWARTQGAKRGTFSTTGAVVMVVGMPNVGKSSLINLLRAKAMRTPEGTGEAAKQVTLFLSRNYSSSNERHSLHVALIAACFPTVELASGSFLTQSGFLERKY